MSSNAYIVRFNVQQRVEHLLTMVIFTLLCLTGLPQKFFQAGWAHALVDVFGGIAWSSPGVMAATRERLAACGARHAELPTLWDVDSHDDLLRWHGRSALAVPE